jgi:phage baseplate assembly protein gpV
MGKNLLADTDYTDGRDQRFVHAVVIGKVSKLEVSEKGANMRVIMPDKIDHTGNPLITKPVPMLQISAGGKKSFAMPRVGQNVLMVKLPNSTSSYAAIGHFYTTKVPPPVTDPMVDYCEWEGGHSEKFDANSGADPFLTQDFKGGWKATIAKAVNIATTGGAAINLTSDGDTNIKSNSGNITVNAPSGTVTIEQQNITLKGTVTIQGNINHTGNMTTSGVHTDSLGHHTNAVALEERIAALEARIAALEA